VLKKVILLTCLPLLIDGLSSCLIFAFASKKFELVPSSVCLSLEYSLLKLKLVVFGLNIDWCHELSRVFERPLETDPFALPI